MLIHHDQWLNLIKSSVLMVKSLVPPVYIPSHQLVKAQSFAKRRVHSSWIGHRTCHDWGCFIHHPCMRHSFFRGADLCLVLSHDYQLWTCTSLDISCRHFDHEIISKFLAGQSTTVLSLLIQYTSSSAPREHRGHPRYSSATPVA